MTKVAIAVAIPAKGHKNPFKALVKSTADLGLLVFDFMYGSKERCNLTFYFALGLLLLGFAIDSTQALANMQNCSTATSL